jgi:hypothetical protein
MSAIFGDITDLEFIDLDSEMWDQFPAVVDPNIGMEAPMPLFFRATEE